MKVKDLVVVHEPFTRFGGDIVGAQVNWSCVGSVDVEVAREFAQELLYACEKADKMNLDLKYSPS